ncbi:hypothetical protein M5K25_002578 [Dendrobium thyrsiflorum]|uniref:Uncharacterized protein n=1 Tax=Dendrobium thyrsiflorum TaxID=117978 RepID=A0ABD0VNN7_DENTH
MKGAKLLLLLSLLAFYLVAITARPLKEKQVFSPAEKSRPSDGQNSMEEKYGPLLLNLLPRGRIPPSGPSGRTNGIQT